MTNDTISLLHECENGIQMGLQAIEGVIQDIKSKQLKDCLLQTKKDHLSLKREIEEILMNYHEKGSEVNPILSTMSQIKTQFKIAMNETDETIANLLVEGIDQGIRTLSKGLNQYSKASSQAKKLVQDLISLDDQLAKKLRMYL